MNTVKCQRLDSEGKRCKRNATYFVTMHQPIECYGSEPKWCVVYVCTHHAHGTKYRINSKDYPLGGEEYNEDKK